MFDDEQLDVVVDVTGKIVYSTNDERHRLTATQTDYSLQADVTKYLGKWELFTSTGFHWLRDDLDPYLRGAWFGVAGVSHPLSVHSSIGVSLYLSQANYFGDRPIKETSVFYAITPQEGTKVRAYMFTGTSNGLPYWGSGVSASYVF